MSASRRDSTRRDRRIGTQAGNITKWSQSGDRAGCRTSIVGDVAHFHFTEGRKRRTNPASPAELESGRAGLRAVCQWKAHVRNTGRPTRRRRLHLPNEQSPVSSDLAVAHAPQPRLHRRHPLGRAVLHREASTADRPPHVLAVSGTARWQDSADDHADQHAARRRSLHLPALRSADHRRADQAETERRWRAVTRLLPLREQLPD